MSQPQRMLKIKKLLKAGFAFFYPLNKAFSKECSMISQTSWWPKKRNKNKLEKQLSFPKKCKNNFNFWHFQ